MHVPDGFFEGHTSIATGVVAAGALGAAAVRGARELAAAGPAASARIPLTGVVAGFVFAGQMLNFPVASGTSGHLIGAVLAAVLLGPWLGSLAVATVVVVQALLFADGGVSALGTNLVLLAVVPTFAGVGILGLLRDHLPATRVGLLVATGVAAFGSVVAASVAFVGLYAVGGTGDAGLASVLGAMVEVHALIGVGEAVISVAAVAAVLAVRPDLVHAAEGLTDLDVDALEAVR